MRAGFGQFNTPTPEFLRFAAQYGVKDVLLAQPQIPDSGGKWAVSDLVKMRIQVENEGLRLMAIENVPLTFYQEIIVGGPNRERQIEKHDRDDPQHSARPGYPSSAITGCLHTYGDRNPR